MTASSGAGLLAVRRSGCYHPQVAETLPSLARAPEARTETVDDLVMYARNGKLRVPRFQRALKWDAEDVSLLFDSIYRGLPIGALLLWKHPAPAERIALGPLHIDAQEIPDAWYVVDGQQRLTSLAAGLARSWPPPEGSSDPFRICFDARRNAFIAWDDTAPSTAVPLPELLDAAQLGEWVLTWEHREDRELRQRVFEAGKRLREYRVPLYVVDTDDEEVLREVFYRVNKRGKQLEWTEVHDAIFGHRAGPPSTLAELKSALTDLDFGQLTKRQLLNTLVAFRGGDVTRSPRENLAEQRTLLDGAVAEVLPALRRVVLFLRTQAGIPHERLLPYGWLLEPLTRFFALHPEPGARSRELLVRWVWRSFLAAHMLEERTLRRRAISAIGRDEQESVQALLGLVPREQVTIALPARFDGRAAESRIVALALFTFRPRHLVTGEVIDVPVLLTKEDRAAFPTILDVPNSGPENRLIHPPTPHNEFQKRCLAAAPGARDSVLGSHAVGAAALGAYLRGDVVEFFKVRRRELVERLFVVADERCAWSQKDRDRPALPGTGGRVGGGDA